MSKKPHKVLLPLLLIAVLAVSAFTFAAASKLRRSKVTGAKPGMSQNPPGATNANRGVYIRRGFLRPQLNLNLTALGDRLEKPGKERLTVIGAFTRSGEAQPSTFVMIAEFPDRLRFTLQQGLHTRVITFDGQQAKALGSSLEAAERDLMETVVYDTAEHFFTTQMEGQATRFLGARFRMDDGSSANYAGPYYDIYQVGDQIKVSADGRQQAKYYYFNSATLMLERVLYEVNRNGVVVKVETLIGGWQKEQGQTIARRIERIENGTSVFIFTINSAVLSPRVNDGVF